MIIHICGMPGVGKLTVAKILSRMIPGARLLDNHLFVDLAVSVCDREMPDYLDFLNEITMRTYAKLAERKKDRVIILTNALVAEEADDMDRLLRAQKLADDMGKPFVPVLITCDEQENIKRIGMPERALKKKLQDEDILKKALLNYTPAHLPDHPNALTIDNTGLTPEEAARAIKDHCSQNVVQCKVTPSALNP